MFSSVRGRLINRHRREATVRVESQRRYRHVVVISRWSHAGAYPTVHPLDLYRARKTLTLREGVGQSKRPMLSRLKGNYSRGHALPIWLEELEQEIGCLPGGGGVQNRETRRIAACVVEREHLVLADRQLGGYW